MQTRVQKKFSNIVLISLLALILGEVWFIITVFYHFDLFLMLLLYVCQAMKIVNLIYQSNTFDKEEFPFTFSFQRREMMRSGVWGSSIDFIMK